MTAPIIDELTVVSYDISDNRRRYRLVKTLEGYGVRVQESVFECWLLPQQLRELQRRLRKIIKQESDCVAYYRLTQSDLEEAILIGVSGTLTCNPSGYLL